jgi:hypothetical protein
MQSLSLRIRWPELNPLSGKVMLRRGLCGELPTKSSPRQAQIIWRTVGNSLGIRRVSGAKLFFPEEMPNVIVEDARWLWSL